MVGRWTSQWKVGTPTPTSVTKPDGCHKALPHASCAMGVSKEATLLLTSCSCVTPVRIEGRPQAGSGVRFADDAEREPSFLKDRQGYE